MVQWYRGLVIFGQEIFGQRGKYSDSVGNIRTDFLRPEVFLSTIFPAFSTFDLFSIVVEITLTAFISTTIESRSMFRLWRPNYRIDLEAKPKLSNERNFKFQNRASISGRITFSSYT